MSGGKFQPGPDKRRHRFTKSECKRGYRAAMRKLFAQWDPVDGPAWIAWKVKGWYGRR